MVTTNSPNEEPQGDLREEPPLEAYEGDVAEAGAGDPVDALAARADELARQEAEEAAALLQLRKEREALFARLNDRQREAVFLPDESALVLAAAGSGKTSVLTARVAHLLTRGSAPLHPKAILAVTFTNKAAAEMRQRLRKLLDRRTVNALWVGTFHSLCNRMLRDNYKAAGLPRSFAILDVDGQEAMCRGILKDMGLTRSAVKETQRKRQASAQASLLGDDSNAEPTPEQRLAAAGAVSEGEAGVVDGGDAGEFVTPAQCAGYISSRKEGGHAPRPPLHSVSTRSSDVEQFEAVYAEYQTRCARSGLLDFQDLLTHTVRLLENDASVRQAMRERFSAILVDEFQDTNDIQYKWLSLLKAPDAQVMAVGDDDQSIYAFRGAKPQNMSLFLRDLAARPDGSKGRLIRLEHNYRSLPHILAVANRVIERNTDRLGKVLRTDKPDHGEKVDLVFYGGGNFEAASIANSIHRMVREQGVQPSEIAILYRANQQSRLLEAELNKRGLPLTVYGGFRFYERQEVKYVLSYLDLVCDPDHDIALAKVANFPPRGLGERTMEELRQDAQIKGVTMMQMIVQRQQDREQNQFSTGAAALKKQLILERFAEQILDLIGAAETLPLHKLIEEVIEKTGLREHYAAEAAESGGEEGNERLANIGELVSAARQFVLDNPELEQEDTLTQLMEYLAHVALMTSTSESDMNAKNTISLMTVHSAKGLEFDHVFVTGLEEKTFPHARALDEDAVVELPPGVDGPGLQEERRLLYVAVTRARKTLELSFCAQRLVNGDIRPMEPSRFLEELPQERIRYIEDRGQQRQERAAAPASERAAAPRRVAIVGTAGRDKQMAPLMTRDLWERMLADAAARVSPADEVISGGAAWADHLAVRLFLDGKASALKLHLPAPLREDGQFEGPGINQGGSAASAANYYHDLFRAATGVDGRKEIALAIGRGATVTVEPAAPGYGAMNARNKKVAAGCDALVAYTWGEGDEPADGGTKMTWDMARSSRREHVPLRKLLQENQAQSSSEGLPPPAQPSRRSAFDGLARTRRMGPGQIESAPAGSRDAWPRQRG